VQQQPKGTATNYNARMKHQQKKLVKQKEEKTCATAKRHYCNNINKPGAAKNRHKPYLHRCISDPVEE
jgi:hypothetical protein